VAMEFTGGRPDHAPFPPTLLAVSSGNPAPIQVASCTQSPSGRCWGLVYAVSVTVEVTRALNRTPCLGVDSVPMAIPPLVAVLSKARHHLHVIPGAVEVLMASPGAHGAQFFNDVRPSFL
jgi:hypothetical protein